MCMEMLYAKLPWSHKNTNMFVVIFNFLLSEIIILKVRINLSCELLHYKYGEYIFLLKNWPRCLKTLDILNYFTLCINTSQILVLTEK